MTWWKLIGKNKMYKQTIAPFLSLFASLGTLVCCALPVLFVTLGMGAVLASFISNFPSVTILNEYKIHIFVFAGLILLFAIFTFWKEKNLSCPSDPKLAKLCVKLRKVNFFILILSAHIYIVGFFFAFLAIKII